VGGPDLQQIYDPIPYLGLILALMALFGITFQFPVILVSLELARVVTPAKLLHSWRWAVILITVVSAVFTPSSDPFSMLALAVPLVAFYFISIASGSWPAVERLPLARHGDGRGERLHHAAPLSSRRLSARGIRRD